MLKWLERKLRKLNQHLDDRARRKREELKKAVDDLQKKVDGMLE